jgi:hypothetical protein
MAEHGADTQVCPYHTGWLDLIFKDLEAETGPATIWLGDGLAGSASRRRYKHFEIFVNHFLRRRVNVISGLV